MIVHASRLSTRSADSFKAVQRYLDRLLKRGLSLEWESDEPTGTVSVAWSSRCEAPEWDTPINEEFTSTSAASLDLAAQHYMRTVALLARDEVIAQVWLED